MTLHELADELIEIRRYARSHPEHVAERLKDVAMFARIYSVRKIHPSLARLGDNIFTALDRILCNPEILEGYLYGAAAEIRELAIKEENAR